jgi:ribulose-5-phosphate 4-epimerase/fuculose-1-phosphate aldolase
MQADFQKEFRTYTDKLCNSGLIADTEPVFGLLDAELCWNTKAQEHLILEKVFAQLNINALLWARPAEPYGTLIDYLAQSSGGTIYPQDTETRTFMHDLPVVERFTADAIIGALQRRKSVITPGHGIVTFGTVGLEQAYVSFACVCFACFVKFFLDFLKASKRKAPERSMQTTFETVCDFLDPLPSFGGPLQSGPFTNAMQIESAMAEAGRQVVAKRLVDAFFGNVSFCDGQTLFISQTGSSLDQLQGCIDPCPLDGSSCVSITASSEYPTHRRIVEKTEHRAILHGHPKFAVILSMDCEIENCQEAGDCHRRCPHDRAVNGIPVVPGEVGSGPYGLANTVPQTLETHHGVIVYGHGVFTADTKDFNRPLKNLIQIENNCRQEYFKRLRG